MRDVGSEERMIRGLGGGGRKLLCDNDRFRSAKFCAGAPFPQVRGKSVRENQLQVLPVARSKVERPNNEHVFAKTIRQETHIIHGLQALVTLYDGSAP